MLFLKFEGVWSCAKVFLHVTTPFLSVCLAQIQSVDMIPILSPHHASVLTFLCQDKGSLLQTTSKRGLQITADYLQMWVRYHRLRLNGANVRNQHDGNEYHLLH